MDNTLNKLLVLFVSLVIFMSTLVLGFCINDEDVNFYHIPDKAQHDRYKECGGKLIRMKIYEVGGSQLLIERDSDLDSERMILAYSSERVADEAVERLWAGYVKRMCLQR